MPPDPATTERAWTLLGQLDHAARDYDRYDYALPVSDTDPAGLVPLTVTALDAHAAAAVAAERERCAQIAWDTTCQMGDFDAADRHHFATMNMTRLHAAIVAAIRATAPAGP